MADLLADVRSRGGDVAHLTTLARNDTWAELHAALKQLGFSKMGVREKIKHTLRAQADAAAAAEASTSTPISSSTPATPTSRLIAACRRTRRQPWDSPSFATQRMRN